MSGRARAISRSQFLREMTEEEHQRTVQLQQLPEPAKVRAVLVPRIAMRVLDGQMQEVCELVGSGHTIASALGQLGLIRCGMPGDDWFVKHAYGPDPRLDWAIRLRRHKYGITWTHGPTVVGRLPEGHRLVIGPYGKFRARPQRLGDQCKRGHVYEEVGYWLNKDGYRVCKECHRARCREHVKQNGPKYREANRRWREKRKAKAKGGP
jgi:hypothetical protein